MPCIQKTSILLVLCALVACSQNNFSTKSKTRDKSENSGVTPGTKDQDLKVNDNPDANPETEDGNPNDNNTNPNDRIVFVDEDQNNEGDESNSATTSDDDILARKDETYSGEAGYRLPRVLTCKYEAKTTLHHAYGYFSVDEEGSLVWHQWRSTQPSYNKSGTGRLWFKKGSQKAELGDVIRNKSSSLAGWVMQWEMEPSGNVERNLMNTEEKINLKSYFAALSTIVLNADYSHGDSGNWPTRIKDCRKVYEDVRQKSKPTAKGF